MEAAAEADRPLRGRPRSAASEQAILQAALDLLAEGQGPASITIAGIARRAGAGKDTIYRRWQNKEDLLLDALASAAEPPTVADEASFREALATMLADMIRRLQRPRDRQILQALQGADDGFPKLRARYHEQVVMRRVNAVHAVVDKAIEDGEITRDEYLRHRIEMPIHHVLMRALEDDPVTGDPDQVARHLIDVVVAGIT